MSSKNNHHKIPAWLQKIQDNSSELELLISGGAIFALFQLSNLATHFFTELQVNSGLSYLNENLLVLQIVLKILTIGFILHLILRGYWLSLVCLNYVFPNGIKWEKLQPKKPFTIQNDERNDLYNEIVYADKLCGMSMYISVLCSITIIGFLFATAILSVMENILDNSIIGGAIMGVMNVMFFVYYVDFFLSGLLITIC